LRSTSDAQLRVSDEGREMGFEEVAKRPGLNVMQGKAALCVEESWDHLNASRGVQEHERVRRDRKHLLALAAQIAHPASRPVPLCLHEKALAKRDVRQIYLEHSQEIGPTPVLFRPLVSA